MDLLIVTHGSLGKALAETSKLIVGSNKKLITLSFDHGDDIEELEKQIVNQMNHSLSDGNELLILADLLGGSPSNRTALALKGLGEKCKDIECIVGVNLPILLEAIILSNQVDSVHELKERCIDAGKNSIQDLKAVVGLSS